MTERDWWNELQKDRKSYEDEKELVAYEVQERLEAAQSWHIVASGNDRCYLTHGGVIPEIMGWLMSLEIINTLIKKTLPGLLNLYTASLWGNSGYTNLYCVLHFDE